MQDIDDIVEKKIIDKINCNIRVTEVLAVDGQTQIVKFCDKKYLRLFGSFFSLDDTKEFSVVQYLENDYVQVFLPENTIISANQVYKIRLPYYFRGTQMAVNFEWKAFSDYEGVKLPLVWLINPIEEDFTPHLPTERTSQLRFFLLTSADFTNDFTKQFRQKNIVPLLSLAHEIVETVINDKVNFNRILTYKTRDFSKFGVEERQGIVKNIIDSNVSGVELTFSLEVLKQNCKC